MRSGPVMVGVNPGAVPLGPERVVLVLFKGATGVRPGPVTIGVVGAVPGRGDVAFVPFSGVPVVVSGVIDKRLNVPVRFELGSVGVNPGLDVVAFVPLSGLDGMILGMALVGGDTVELVPLGKEIGVLVTPGTVGE